MQVLVDISIWIDYFRDGNASSRLGMLIDENLIVTNDVILAELIPFLRIKRQHQIIALLEEVQKNKLDINWPEIVDLQTQCLASGTNGMGIPDLVIAQNAQQNGCAVYSLDKHFRQLEKIMNISLHYS